MSSFEHVDISLAAGTSHDDTPLADSTVFTAPAPAPPPQLQRDSEPAPDADQEVPAHPSSSRMVHDPIKEIEEAAERVMGTAVHAAKDVSLLATEAAREARQSLSSLASGFSSWWSTLDAPVQSQGSGFSAEEREAVALAVSLGLEPGEAVLESFPCRLWQTYRASNGLTPDQQVAFPGELHITSQNIVFIASQRSKLPDPLRLPLASVRSSCKAGVGAQQRLVLSSSVAEGEVVFGSFAGPGPESALALLEHFAASE